MESSEEKLNEIVKHLELNEATNKEILKSVKFVRNYFFWQSSYSFLKIIILLSVIVLGFISWRSITDYLLKIYG
ncbi:MAG: hypothetical protein WCT50_03450 [Patescibacteria group bacterium]